MRLELTNFSSTRSYSGAIMICCIVCLALAATPASAVSEGSFQRTLKVSGTVNVDIMTGSGNIEIRTGSASEVQISGRIRANRWFGGNSDDKIKRLENNPPIQQNGNDIRIGHIDDPDLRRAISISYEVLVPADTQLRAHTGSGNAKAEGLNGSVDISSGSGNVETSSIGNTVHAETGSGDIKLEGAKGNSRAKTGSGTIRASGIAGGFEGSTGSGDLQLEQTSSGSVRVSSGSGSLDLRGIRGSLDADSGSGSIRADGDPTGPWKVRTGSGSVQLRVPSNAAFDLNAHTGSGSISVNLPIASESSNDKKDLRGKVRGGGVSMRIETGSGDVEIR